MTAFLKKLLANVVAWVKANPARAISYVTAAVVFVAARLGVILNADELYQDLLVAASILGAGELTHRKVSPAA